MERPNPQRHVQPLTPGAGALPWTEGFQAARDGWVSGWRREQAAFVSAIRSEQAKVGGNSARFGANQLQGFGSTKNLDYAAKRWEGLAGQYVVGGGDYERKVVSQGNAATYGVSGVQAWMRQLDAEVRIRVASAMDATVAPWFYRAAFHNDLDLNVKVERDIWVLPDGTEGFGPGAVKQHVKRTEQRHYTGWPVWSGFSRSALDLEWVADPADLTVRARSRAPYTLAAGATRAAWTNLKRSLRTLVAGLGQKLQADLEALHG